VCERAVAGWPKGLGSAFILVALFSEGALLFVAAQTGFLGGPSVLATMAKDHWVPTRYSLLSNRLVVQNGILLIGGAAAVTLILAGGSVHLLVVFYSINVFITFSFSQLGMVRHWWASSLPFRQRARRLLVSGGGLLLSLAILLCLVVLKFNAGGWITMAVTLTLVGVVMWVRKEYSHTARMLKRLDTLVAAVEMSVPERSAKAEVKSAGPARTAVLLVSGYGGVGLHSLLAILRLFGESFRRFVFVQVGVIDAANFKGTEEIRGLEAHTRSEVDRYVALMQRQGYEAEGVAVIGLDVAQEITQLAPRLLERYPGAVFFGGRLVFRQDSWTTRLLYNSTIFDIQRLLYQAGIQFVILPIRV
jgi:hypothetical protein